jgi:hypothetical protein
VQPGKKAVDLIIDFLSCIWEYAKQQITREIGAVADLGMYTLPPNAVNWTETLTRISLTPLPHSSPQGAADVWLTVPAAWDAMGCQMMREAAITAGLVQSSRAGDRDWRDRLRIITYGPSLVALYTLLTVDIRTF